MKPGDHATVSGYSFELGGFREHSAFNYVDLIGSFKVTKDGKEVTELHPAKRVYTSRNMPTTETAIYTIGGVTQLYVSLGDKQDDDGIGVRIYYKPWVTFIWLGCVVMFIGGCFSLSESPVANWCSGPKGARQGGCWNGMMALLSREQG